MNDLEARWVLTVGILYTISEGRRSYWSCKNWEGSEKFSLQFDLYHCSRLVSRVYRMQRSCRKLCISYLISLESEVGERGCY